MFFLLITSLRRARRERSDGIDDRRRAEKGQVANNNAQGVEKLRRHKAQQSVGSGGDLTKPPARRDRVLCASGTPMAPRHECRITCSGA